MKATHYRWIAMLFILVGIPLMVTSLRKQIILVVDGKSTSYNTYALTTGQFLESMAIPYSIEDQISPPPNSLLHTGEAVRLERAITVVIEADGLTYRFHSASRLPANLLAEASLRLFPGDQVWLQNEPVEPDQALVPSSAYALQVRRAVPVAIQQGNQAFSTNATQGENLAKAAWSAGLRLRSADQASLPLFASLASNLHFISGVLQAQLKPARTITIQLAGEEIHVYSSAGTVAEALAENGLSPAGLDYSVPSLETPLPADGQVRLIRVQEQLVIEQSPLPFETKYEPVADLEIDNKKVVQAGKYGINARRIRVRLEDGQEVSRQVEGEWIASQPQDRIIGYGTSVVPHTLDTPNGPIQYWRAVSMWATSYRPADTGKTTASGLPLKKGVAAVDRYLVPLGTQLYVPGYGPVVAADTGSGVRGRWIDLGYSDSDYESWHQWVTVYFLWPPPGNIVWMIP